MKVGGKQRLHRLVAAEELSAPSREVSTKLDRYETGTHAPAARATDNSNSIQWAKLGERLGAFAIALSLLGNSAMATDLPKNLALEMGPPSPIVKTLSKAEFERTMHNKAVNLDDLLANPRLVLRKVDRNHDGRIEGQREMSAAWSAIDAKDHDGRRATIAAADRSGLTEAGTLAEAMLTNAKASETFTHAAFRDEMSGKMVALTDLSPTQQAQLRHADKDHDGTITRGEMDAAWRAIDSTDNNGNPRSIRAVDGGELTPAGTLAAAVMNHAVTDPNSIVHQGDVTELRNWLAQPLKKYAETFVREGRKNGVDPRFLAAIAMHETGRGTSRAFRVKHNAMGIVYSSGLAKFARVEDSIAKMAKTLGSPTGYYRKASTIVEIANIYAPVGAKNDPTGLNRHWPRGVLHGMQSQGVANPGSVTVRGG